MQLPQLRKCGRASSTSPRPSTNGVMPSGMPPFLAERSGRKSIRQSQRMDTRLFLTSQGNAGLGTHPSNHNPASYTSSLSPVRERLAVSTRDRLCYTAPKLAPALDDVEILDLGTPTAMQRRGNPGSPAPASAPKQVVLPQPLARAHVVPNDRQPPPLEMTPNASQSLAKVFFPKELRCIKGSTSPMHVRRIVSRSAFDEPAAQASPEASPPTSPCSPTSPSSPQSPCSPVAGSPLAATRARAQGCGMFNRVCTPESGAGRVPHECHRSSLAGAKRDSFASATLASSARARTRAAAPAEPKPAACIEMLLPLPGLLRMWQAVLLYRGCLEGGLANPLLDPGYAALKAEKQYAVRCRCAVLGVSPALARRMLFWEYRARGAARGFDMKRGEEITAEMFDIIDTVQVLSIKTAARGKRATQEKHNTRSRDQGNPEFLSSEALATRCAIKQDEGVQAAMKTMWEAMPKCYPPHSDFIDRQIYHWMCARILEGDVPQAERQGATYEYTDDWWYESKGEWFMDFDGFFDSIYTYIDMWVPTLCVRDYVKKIESVMELVKTAISFAYSLKLSHRHWVEWLHHHGCEEEAEGFKSQLAGSVQAKGLKKVVEPVKRRITRLSPERFPYEELHLVNKNNRRGTRREGPSPTSVSPTKRTSLSGVGGGHRTQRAPSTSARRSFSNVESPATTDLGGSARSPTISLGSTLDTPADALTPQSKTPHLALGPGIRRRSRSLSVASALPSRPATPAIICQAKMQQRADLVRSSISGSHDGIDLAATAPALHTAYEPDAPVQDSRIGPLTRAMEPLPTTATLRGNMAKQTLAPIFNQPEEPKPPPKKPGFRF